MGFPRTVEAVVFDMDGLLLDSEVLVQAGVMQAASILGYDFPETLFAQTMGCSDAAYVASVARHFGPDFPLDRFLEVERVEIDREIAAGVALKTGVIELIDHLDALCLPYAVATSSTGATARRHLEEQHAIHHRFQTVVAREDVQQHKPHPAPYLEAARRLGVDPVHCLALEDSHNGVRAAQAAGMMTVMVPDLLDPTDEMRGLCVHIADSLHAVRAMLDG